MTLLPMLATPTSPASGRTGVEFEQIMATGDWVADVKLDGCRCMATWDGSSVRLSNRQGVAINYRYPEVATALTDVLMGMDALILDGEIVARDGKFESTLLRDKQEDARTIVRMAESHPVLFAAFDVPDETSLYEARRQRLEVVAMDWQVSQYADTLATTVTSLSPDFLAQTRELGMEGVIAKRVNSRYEYGKRSRNWLKFKCTSRVTCLVAGYTLGTGSRSHFGALELALLGDDGIPVSVGRCGTGFTDGEIRFLKLAIDRGDLLVVEIECLNRTSSNQLRFPVYIDVRRDVAPSDCLLKQLEFLPYC